MQFLSLSASILLINMKLNVTQKLDTAVQMVL